MLEGVELRQCLPGDGEAVKELYRAAFPEEDLLPLLERLSGCPELRLSLVALVGPSLVGHVAFTTCALSASGDSAALLGPLAVAPRYQRQGIGSAIVRDGLRRLAASGPFRVFVLGDPDYYRRFGFAAEARVAPPYPLPAAWRGAWQSLCLGSAKPAGEDRLVVPPPWDQPALWRP